MGKLTSAFLEALPADADRSVAEEALESAIERACATARLAHPALRLDDAAFATHLAAHIPAGKPVLDAIAAVHAADVCLVLACLRGDRAALAAFEQAIGTVVSRLVRAGVAPSTADDAAQTARMKLFAPAPGEMPKLAGYSGRGRLVSWLHVMLARDARVVEDKRRSLAGDSALAEQLADGRDVELDIMKRRFGAVFQRCFRAAVPLLTPGERNLLRFSIVHGLSIDEIGALYRVHRATAARRLTAARDRLTELTFGLMSRELAVGDDELRSILRLIRSQLDISLTALGNEPSADEQLNG